jgi:hypothetical protein
MTGRSGGELLWSPRKDLGEQPPHSSRLFCPQLGQIVMGGIEGVFLRSGIRGTLRADELINGLMPFSKGPKKPFSIDPRSRNLAPSWNLASSMTGFTNYSIETEDFHFRTSARAKLDFLVNHQAEKGRGNNQSSMDL